jgi:pimeloyl-ACP methyl ester carboxylesterase
MRAVRGSGGYFSIEGWVRDATAIVAAARELQPTSGGLGRRANKSVPLILVGSSAGGAVSAVAVARGLEVDALALLAAPAHWASFAANARAGAARIVEQAGMQLAEDVLADPQAWADEFLTVSAVDAMPDIHIPTLIVHGTADDVVPVGHADELARAAPHAEAQIVDGAPHQLRRDPRALEVVFDWLDKLP